MTSLGEVAEESARGSFIIFIGNVISLLFAALGSILVARMLSPSEYGLFSLSLVLPGFIIIFTNWGVNSALTRFLAMYKLQDNKEKIKVFIRVGFLFKITAGTVLFLFQFILADILATFVLARPEVGNYVRITSFLILSESIFYTALSIFSGIDRMGYRAFMGVSQSIIKSISSIFLVYIGLGVNGAVIGHVLSYIVTGIIGIGLSFYLTVSRMKTYPESVGYFDSLKMMLNFGFPLFIGQTFSGFSSSFRSFLIPWFFSNEIIGNYGVAGRFLSIINVITSSLGVNIYPAFSKFDYNRAPNKIKILFNNSVRYSTLTLVPLVMFMIGVSKQIVFLFYTSKYPYAPLYLSLLLVPVLMIGAGHLSIGSFLNSQGDTEIKSKIDITGSIVSIITAPVLIWIIGIEGLIMSIIISRIIVVIYNLQVMQKKYNISVDLKYMAKNMICSMISIGLVYFAYWFFPTFTPFYNLILGAVIFFISYLILAPLFSLIELQDIKNLDFMFSKISIIYPFIRIILSVEEKLIKVF